MTTRLLGQLLPFLDGLPEPRMVMDTDYRIVGANRAYLREFSQGQPIRGRTCYEISHHFNVPCDQAGESCPLKQAMETGIPQRVLHQHHTPRGEEHVEVEIAPIFDESGEQPLYFVETMHVVRQASSRVAAQGLVGRAPAFVDMLQKVMRVAPAEATVLLLGETGTGKELVARAIHEASPRSNGPFVAVDCAGLTETLFESELFGYEKGAFTGANHRKQGLVEAASGGTLFLDEIGELPLSLQVKLLRLLETGTYRRVGGLDWLPADFRLVAATHRNLRRMVHDEQFRRDLYFRINTFPLRTPALHERASDIPLLAHSLLERVDRQSGRRIADEALTWLSQRRYTGNIRELRNLIERATLMADGPQIELMHFIETDDPMDADSPPPASDSRHDFRIDQLLALDEVEARYLAWSRQHHQGTIESLAGQLGVSSRTLFRKLQHPGKAAEPDSSGVE